MFTAAVLALAGVSTAGDRFARVQSVGGGGGPQVWKSFGTFLEIVLERRWGWGLRTLEAFVTWAQPVIWGVQGCLAGGDEEAEQELGESEACVCVLGHSVVSNSFATPWGVAR